MLAAVLMDVQMRHSILLQSVVKNIKKSYLMFAERALRHTRHAKSTSHWTKVTVRVQAHCTNINSFVVEKRTAACYKALDLQFLLEWHFC